VTRKIYYLSGTRADYGLMRHSLAAIAAHEGIDLGIIVTGMHLDARFGSTWREIEADGHRIVGTIPNALTGDNASMARDIAATIEGCCDIFATERPDLLLLLGDRGEMLAGAIAAIHDNVFVAHIHGGERSGTVDEPVRHAISRLAHLHLPATEDGAMRLERMGERADCIFVVGAPGLDHLERGACISRAELMASMGWANDSRVALLVFHPVVQTADDGARQVAAILAALRSERYKIVGLRPNADTGGEAIRAMLEQHGDDPDLQLHTHLPRDAFVSWMAIADVMIGNSSSGIIEAASFGTPVINVGNRQRLRERNHNVRDVDASEEQIGAALAQVRQSGRFAQRNLYGDGQSARRIAQLLAEIPLPTTLLDKACAY
jgi:GDP/UDP-N,N'-diacetylbacillosamine 2-epimerase (hydrolysing)